MALLADGLHMGSHALALSIAAFAYIYARRHARDEQFSFGTGKVNSLAGFSGAVLLGVFALMMAWESVERMFNPVAISFDQAILVAVVGLIVNAVSVFVLGGHHDNHSHDHDHDHHEHRGDCHHQDHNLRSAYLHVMADALTSVLAIGALLSGKFLGWNWLDPVMGIVGAALITHWSIGLLRSTGYVLLDKQGPARLESAIREGIEGPEQKITDLHTWAIGPEKYAAIVSVVTCKPETAEHYKSLVPNGLGLVHISVEVHHCPLH
jgi:cation diffusion facilitator family transporter